MSKCLTILNYARGLDGEGEPRRQICNVGRRMYGRGLVVACEGNVSTRLEPDRILVTPAGVCKGHLAPQDLLVTDSSGAVIYGTGRPSSEILMHLLFYSLRPDVHAVCHAHPPMLENHGVVTCGRDLTTAYQRMETVEQFARILLTAECLGGPHLLSRAEVQKLIASRSPSRASSPESTVELTLEPR